MPRLQSMVHGVRQGPTHFHLSADPDRDLVAANERFYDRLWARSYFVHPERFNTWPLMRDLAVAAPQRLEVGAGLRPRLPIRDSHFADLSPVAVRELSVRGGLARCADAARLPYETSAFDLVCALDIIEHVADEHAVLSELTRVLKPGGTLILAIPLHPERWTSFDTVVGHARRYSPDQLLAALSRHGLTLERSAPYGMQSSSRRLCNFTAVGFFRTPRFTIFIYNRLVLPLGMLLQKPLRFYDGLLDTREIDEVLLICRRE